MARKLDRKGSFSTLHEEDRSGGVGGIGDTDDTGLAFAARGPNDLATAALKAPGGDILVGSGHAKEYSMSDRFYYKLENTISGNPNVR